MLNSSQRKHLRGLAHGLRPVIQIGRKGLTEGIFDEMDKALADHELIKIQFLEHKDQKSEFCEELAKRTDSQWVGLIGHVGTFYRQQEDPDKRRIEVPGEPAGEAAQNEGREG